MGTKVKKEVAYDEILKRFEYTVREYIRFYDFYRNQDISSENTDAFYIMLQTKLMVLRKYDYNREEIYLEKIFEAINQEYPDLKDKADALKQRFHELSNYCMEVILSDGRKGIIFDNREVHNLRPVVKLYSGELLDLSRKEYLSIGLECITDQKQEVTEGYEEERKEMIKDFYHAKVMVVDDMKSNLQVLNEILKYSYEVILMKSGSQALTYLEKKGFPDLILLDIDMPEMDGIETAERMLELTKGKVPIIFVTALCDRETVLRCRQLKVSGYIVRPYKPVYVRSEIKRILEGRSDIG